MNEESEFKVLESVRLRGKSTVSTRYRLPPELVPYDLHAQYVDAALDYYLLSRFAESHRMLEAYMRTSFWAVEYILLSVLCFKYPTKEDLSKVCDFHDLWAYWKLFKKLNPELEPVLKRFDACIGKVKGYYKHRYPTDQCVTIFTGKRPVIRNGSGEAVNSDTEAEINLHELDHFFGFMLHDIVGPSHDPSANFMEKLASRECTDLYLENNKYSIIYPNKKYHGEISLDPTDTKK